MDTSNIEEMALTEEEIIKDVLEITNKSVLKVISLKTLAAYLFFEKYLTPEQAANIIVLGWNGRTAEIWEQDFKWIFDRLDQKRAYEVLLRSGKYNSDWCDIKEMLHKVKSDIPLSNLQDFHDHLVEKINLEKYENKSYNRSDIKDIVTPEFDIIAPKNTLELLKWGQEMKNCIFNYSGKFAAKECNIYGVFDKNSQILYNIKTDLDNNIQEIKAKFNKSVDDRVVNKIQKLLKGKHVKKIR